jgi:hypothetical protein
VTFANWDKAILGPRTPNFFSLEFSLDGNPAPERVVVVFSAAGHMQAGVFTQRGRFLGAARASKPNGHTVAVVIRKALLKNPAGYHWQVLACFQGATVCPNRCVDRAPDGAGKNLHDLRAPTISFEPPQAPAMGLMYNVDFSVGDSGGSGLATWELQRRDAGTVAWTPFEDGNTTGPQSFPFTAAGPGETDEFRVIAIDAQGNRRVSPIRSVTVP